MTSVVDAVLDALRRERLCDTPEAELRALGLDAQGSEAPWAALDEAQWRELLAALAAVRPATAVALLAHWLADRMALPATSAPALWARGDDACWQVRRPSGHAMADTWVFVAEGRLWAVPRNAWQQVGAQAWECPRQEASGMPLRAGVLDGYESMLRALLIGCVRGAWDAALDHVSQRRMFGRTMAELPPIQWRLSQAHEQALAGDFQAFRVEVEQICGGTGYMAESPIAHALGWLTWAEGLDWQGADAALCAAVDV